MIICARSCPSERVGNSMRKETAVSARNTALLRGWDKKPGIRAVRNSYSSFVVQAFDRINMVEGKPCVLATGDQGPVNTTPR